MLSFQSLLRKNEDLSRYKLLKTLSSDELKQLQHILLEIYIDVSEFCKKHNLTVMLGGGSALGAVRHHGFIPWDDDMDLMMPRADYDKFIELFDKELSEKYYFAAPSRKAKYINYCIQIIKKNTVYIGLDDRSKFVPEGIGIDIFAIDAIPANRLHRMMKGMSAQIVYFVANSVSLYLCRNAYISNFFKRNVVLNLYYFIRVNVIGRVFSVFTYDKLWLLFDRLIRYNKTSELQGIPSGRKHYFGEISSPGVFLPVSKGIFEGLEVNIPNDVGKYLSNLYGNYMEIPPVEKREIHPCVKFSVDRNG